MKIRKHYLICVFIISFFNNMTAMHFLPNWVKQTVEEVSDEYGIRAPRIYEEMRSVRIFNPHVTPTCTDIRFSDGKIVIGDRLIEKLNVEELKILIKRAFVYSQKCYFSKKLSLVAAILISNAYFFQNRKDAPLQAAGMFLLDVIIYLGLNVYSEKQIDKEVIKNAQDQEILDSAYQKISPNRWPLYHSFYKNVGRYIGF